MKRIETWNRRYFIRERWFQGYEQVAYLAREENKDGKVGGRDVNLVWIKDGEVAKQFLGFYADNPEAFSHAACFMEEGRFYVVFPYEPGTPLFQKVREEGCELKERLTIGKNLLNHLVLAGLPHYLNWDALVEDRVLASPSLSLSFLHKLKDVWNFGVYGKKEVFIELERTYSRLFEREVDWEVSDALTDFLQALRDGERCDYVDAYELYLKAYDELWEMDSRHAVYPRKRAFRLWERMKGAFLGCRRAFAVTLILLSLAYTLVTLLSPKPKKEVPDEAYCFTFLGGVAIDADKEDKRGEAP